MANGHARARQYPIGVVWIESQMVQKMLNGRDASNALLIQGAIGAALSSEGAKEFREQIESLTK